MKKTGKFKIKAVIFDMDGVITNTMPYHFNAWLATFQSIGIKVNCYDIYKREGQDGLTSAKEILKEYRRRFSLKDAKWVLSQKENLFKRIVKIKFVKGARPFIRFLKMRKVLLGLVTGTSRQEVKKILPKNLLNIFDVSITGDEVKKGKPNPEPFLKALNSLGVSSREAIVLENSPFGITAAKRGGLYCIALETSLPKKYLKGADDIVKSYDELRQKLRDSNGFFLYRRGV